MAREKMSAQDKKWQAEQDARILADAQEILSSRARKAAAVKAAKDLAKNAQKQANNYKKVSSRTQNKKKSTRKGR